jgi:hypothetical protein
VWFSDEVLPIQDAVASVLSRAPIGLRVIPVHEVRGLWASAQQGMLPGRAQRCDAAPPPSLLTGVVYPDALRATVEVRCENKGECELQVVLIDSKQGDRDGDQEVARYGLKLQSGLDPRRWGEMIGSSPWSQWSKPDPEGGLGLVGGVMTPGTKPGVYVVVHGLTQSGPWASELDGSTFQSRAEQWKTCKDTRRRWRDWWGQEHVIEVNSLGKVTRCEYPLPDHLPPPDFACKCDLLRTMDFGPAAAPRRASFYLDVTTLTEGAARRPSLYRSAYLVNKKASDRSAVLGTRVVDEQTLGRCLDPVEQALGELEVPVRFEVSSDGRTVRHAARWPETLPATVRTCMDAELSTAWFNCPLQGSSIVQATVSIAVKPYAKPTHVRRTPSETTIVPSEPASVGTAPGQKQ